MSHVRPMFLFFRQKEEQIKKEKLRRKEAEVQCHVRGFQSHFKLFLWPSYLPSVDMVTSLIAYLFLEIKNSPKTVEGKTGCG